MCSAVGAGQGDQEMGAHCCGARLAPQRTPPSADLHIPFNLCCTSYTQKHFFMCTSLVLKLGDYQTGRSVSLEGCTGTGT